jgi:hypothetical protein
MLFDLPTGAAMAEGGDPTSRRTAVFSIVANHDPQLLCRLMGTIAQQDRLVHSLSLGSTPRRQRLLVELQDIDRPRAELLAEKMRRFVDVRSVRLHWR